MKTLATLCAGLLVVAANATAQLTLPPSGDNQKASVTQHIGPVKITVDYSSPDVHAPHGDDRRGKIWGQLVPYGTIDEDFGTCKQCPWRAGSNENTVFTTSHDVLVEGQRLPAGSYGLFMIPDPNEWTVIFSKNSSSWGHYTYDPAEDALRVKVKPSKAEYNEWLTYEFVDRRADRTTVALKWEDLQVPVTISVPNISDLYIARLRNELRGYTGFRWDNWTAAAEYALAQKRYDDALEFATNAKNSAFQGQENFRLMTALADAQEGKGMAAEAKASRDKALNHATANAVGIHQYARTLLQRGNKAEAIRVWELNAKRFPKEWPVNVGLMRAHSAHGRYKEALAAARAALAQAPDDMNRKSIEAAIKKLEAGQDVN